MFSAVGSLGGLHAVAHKLPIDGSPSPAPAGIARRGHLISWRKSNPARRTGSFLPLSAKAGGVGQEDAILEDSKASEDARQQRRSADWKAARTYKESGVIYNGRVDGFNNGGLRVRFYSLLGFLPFPQLSPSHSQKEPQKSIQDIGKGLVGSYISVKILYASEEEKKLIFSEKDAIWSTYSSEITEGDAVEGRVASVEDYGAFIDLRFPDGEYRLTGLVHISEVSWDLVQDVRDILSQGDLVKVKVINVDREKAKIRLSIKQLVDDPLMERLDKVIPQEGQPESDIAGLSSDAKMEPLPELETICNELLQEEGITDIQLGRQGVEKRVVSQDLELWLSSAPAKDNQFTLIARAGRQVQEVYLTTALEQDGIKQAVQRVLGRVP